jgi:hypothetical protein
VKTELANEIAQALYPISAYKLPKVCQAFGLAEGTGEEAFSSKNRYVLTRLEGLSEDDLVELAEKVVAQHPRYSLEELLGKLKPSVSYRIGELTRRAVVRELNRLGDLSGHLGIVEFLERIWSLKQIKAVDHGSLNGCHTMADSVFQHMVRNDDWSITDLLEYLNAYSISDLRFGKCLELVVSPLVRDEAGQKSYAARLNTLLAKDGVELRHVEEQSGYPVYRIVPLRDGVSGRAKNLIFAADGPKPSLVLEDAVNNDVKIVENAEFCLIYEESIPAGGLLWKDLVIWWAKKNGLQPDDPQTARSLYKRLAKSLVSEPEKTLFYAYYKRFNSLGDRLPALVPQVYLHYDPYTRRDLGGVRRLPRQRMDFLMLLSHYHRVVVEVDGKQHYADGDTASPQKYAEMVCADRELKLAGYDVYRFGGAELFGPDAENLVFSFFNQLFTKYQRA